MEETSGRDLQDGLIVDRRILTGQQELRYAAACKEKREGRNDWLNADESDQTAVQQPDEPTIPAPRSNERDEAAPPGRRAH